MSDVATVDDTIGQGGSRRIPSSDPWWTLLSSIDVPCLATRLAHGDSQPTLDDLPDPPVADGLESLCLIEGAALLAMWHSTTERAPTTPSPSLTTFLSDWLHRRRVIELGPRLKLGEAWTTVRAIYDPLTWRYLWADAADVSFYERLLDQVRQQSDSEGTADQRFRLWKMLADAELESYFASLLRRHGFDTRWAHDLLMEPGRWDSGRITLSQMRYAVWAGVREGASMFLKSDGDLDETREAIFREICRRVVWMATRPDWGANFMPGPGGMKAILLRVFLDHVTRLGDRYWTVAPSVEIFGALP